MWPTPSAAEPVYSLSSAAGLEWVGGFCFAHGRTRARREGVRSTPLHGRDSGVRGLLPRCAHWVGHWDAAAGHNAVAERPDKLMEPRAPLVAKRSPGRQRELVGAGLDSVSGGTASGGERPGGIEPAALAQAFLGGGPLVVAPATVLLNR